MICFQLTILPVTLSEYNRTTTYLSNSSGMVRGSFFQASSPGPRIADPRIDWSLLRAAGDQLESGHRLGGFVTIARSGGQSQRRGAPAGYAVRFFGGQKEYIIPFTTN